MALMQKCIQTSSKHLKTRMQHDNMNLHAILSKFHIEHTQNGATVQHIHYTSLKDKLSKTATRHLASNKTIRYNIWTWKQKAWHEVQMKLNKTWTLSYLQKSLEHTQKHIARLQIITVYRLSRNNIRLQCLEPSNNMLQELNMANKSMAWTY